MYEITDLQKRMITIVIPKNIIEISTRQAKHTFTSFFSRDTTFAVIKNMRSRISQSSMDGPDSSTVVACACAKDGTHSRETVMDTVNAMSHHWHNLMFASGFMINFMVGIQNLKLLFPAQAHITFLRRLDSFHFL